jgi:hypothetical protein
MATTAAMKPDHYPQNRIRRVIPDMGIRQDGALANANCDREERPNSAASNGHQRKPDRFVVDQGLRDPHRQNDNDDHRD